MKRIAGIFLLFLSFGSAAQTRVGLRGGFNAASIWFNDFKPEKKMIHRVNLGTTIEIPIDENWSFNTGPYYAGKGVIYARTPSTGKIDSVTIRLNYIELPMDISYKFDSPKDNKIAIVGGVYLGYGFNGVIKTIHSSNPPTTHLHKKETDQYKRLDFGFNAGALYEIKNRYGIRFDFSRSLSNIQRVEKEKNIVLSLSFFLYLKKGKGSPE